MALKRVILSVLFVALLFVFAGAQTPRIVKIPHKVPADTIMIPESVFADELPSDTIVPIYIDVIEVEPPAICSLPVENNDSIDPSLSILGKSLVDSETMYQFVVKRNPSFNREIADAFYEIGEIYGIRGDVAMCQAIIETGWFLFTGGTAVSLEQNNFCGLGVTKKGLKGHSFDTVREGVTAQIQHLYAYATKEKLPNGEKTVDPRFSLVPRGVAVSWADLNNRWAANSYYGESIIRVYLEMISDTNE